MERGHTGSRGTAHHDAKLNVFLGFTPLAYLALVVRRLDGCGKSVSVLDVESKGGYGRNWHRRDGGREMIIVIITNVKASSDNGMFQWSATKSNIPDGGESL